LIWKSSGKKNFEKWVVFLCRIGYLCQNFKGSVNVSFQITKKSVLVVAPSLAVGNLNFL